MNISVSDRASILVHALPYIKEYYGKTVVIKYGGNAMINDELKNDVMSDIVLLSLVGVKVVLVHGGGPEISDMLKKIGKKSEFINGLRVTDRETAEVAQMVLAGKINKNLVSLIGNIGGRAIGLSGLDSHMISAVKMNEDLGFVGEITDIDASVITDALNMGYIPVISTVGGDCLGNSYNINADTAAAAIAAALKAECLISMTDIDGVMKDVNDPSSLIPVIKIDEAPQLIQDGIISGGMIPKIACCIDSIRQGVHKVFILNGTIPHSILIETLTDEGIGTMFV